MNLKPCPFCDGKAQVEEQWNGRWSVWCSNLDCFVRYTAIRTFRDEESAAEAWNRRSERTCHSVDEVNPSVWLVCSECGYGDDDLALISNYCPACGAKVVEG